MWISADPALGEYLPVAPLDDDAKKHNQQLPGQGGVFNLVNLNLYHYAANNPIKYTDPTGLETKMIIYVDQPGSGGDRDTFEMHNGVPYTGHAFVELIDTDAGYDQTFGFYPDYSDGNHPKDVLFGESVPGLVRNDAEYEPAKVDVTKSFDITKEGFFAALGYVDTVKTFDVEYNLSDYNCVDFVLGVSSSAGVELPDTEGSWIVGSGSNPGDFGEDLRALEQ